jgi:hypothetical protein
MPRLTTVFATPPDEDTLDGLTLWLDQIIFEGFESVAYRFEYADEQIDTVIPASMSEARLLRMCGAIDEALNRIVRHLAPATTITAASGEHA